jgi:hypothetical protein
VPADGIALTPAPLPKGEGILNGCLKMAAKNNSKKECIHMALKQTVRRLIMLNGVAILAFGAQAAHAGVNVNINLGAPERVYVAPPPPVYVAPPPPVYAPPPVYVPPPPPEMVVEEDVQFIYPEALGFYVAVGVPYDMFYLNNSYFMFRDGRWLRAPSSRGPWMMQSFRDLPPVLRRNRLERIREYRNREYVIFRRDRDHYRGRQIYSEKGYRKEQHREEKVQHKQEKRVEKEQRRDEKELRRDEKRAEKEERREQH